MEKQKKQLIILLLLLIAAAAAFWFLSHSLNENVQEDTSQEEGFAVIDIEADQVTKLIFTNANGTFSLRKEGEEWCLDEDKTVDIDENQVEKLLAAVAPYRSTDRIEQVEDLSVYGLDDPVRTIMVSDGEKNYTLLVGDFNEITETYYICMEEDTSTVYTAGYDTVSTFEVELEDLKAEQVEEETHEETAEAVSE